MKWSLQFDMVKFFSQLDGSFYILSTAGEREL